MVRMFGSVSRALVLAVADRELVSEHGNCTDVVPGREHQDMIRRFHDSLFAGHIGVSQTVYHLQD